MLELGDRWAIVAVDLTKFYDTIQRAELIDKLHTRSTLSAEFPRSEFRRQLTALFSWDCHPDDEPLVELFHSLSPADGLPQGLAASGFFSNAYMLDFDAAMQRKLDRRIPERQWKIVDYCRYVDDMRFLVAFDEEIPGVGSDRDEFKAQFLRQIKPSLSRHATGTRFHEDETNKAKIDFVFGGETAAYVPLANAVERISRKASGPIDFESAIEILADLDGLLAESGRDRPATKVQGTRVDDEIKNLISKEPDV